MNFQYLIKFSKTIDSNDFDDRINILSILIEQVKDPEPEQILELMQILKKDSDKFIAFQKLSSSKLKG